MMPLCSIKLNDVQVFMMAQRDSVTAFRRGPILALHTSLKMLARLMNDPRATDVIFVPWRGGARQLQCDECERGSHPLHAGPRLLRRVAQSFAVQFGKSCSDAQRGKIAARDVLTAAGRELRLAVHAHVHRAARQGEDSGEGVTVVSKWFRRVDKKNPRSCRARRPG